MKDFKLTNQDSDRIHLTSPKFLKKIALTRLLIISLIAVAVLSCFLLVGVEYFSLFVLFAGILCAFAIDRYFRRNVYSVCLKGETLIHQRLDHTSYLTSIRSIGKVRGLRLFGLECIRYVYHLDGVKRRIVFFTSMRPDERRVYDFVLEAREKFKKEKANHKPDSVSVA